MTETTWHQPALELPAAGEPEAKTCTTCGAAKPIGEFAVRTDQPGKRRGVCRECRNARQRAMPRTEEVKATARERATAYRQTDAYKQTRPEIMRRHTEKRKAIGQTIERESKACPRCDEVKARSEFQANASSADGMSAYCRPCSVAVQQEYRERNPDRIRAGNRQTKLKKMYGLTIEEYDRILAEQGGGCVICGSTVANGRWDNLHVDHHHQCGAIRGLLDNLCNTAIGLFDDEPDLLIKAAEYLESFPRADADV